jgi:hypothetical protein
VNATVRTQHTARSTAPASRSRQDRCTHGHFMAAGDTTCHKDGCGAPRRPRLSLVHPQRPQPITIVTTIGPDLPHRHPAATRADTGARAFAVHAAMMAGLPATVLGWAERPDGTAYQYLPNGTLLSHPGTYGAAITATTNCVRGGAHVHLVTSQRGLYTALETAAHCRIAHTVLVARAAPAGLPTPTQAPTRPAPSGGEPWRAGQHLGAIPLHHKPTG